MSDGWRRLENRVMRAVRHPAAASILDAPPSPWSAEALTAGGYCLVASRRRDGSAVVTPVWCARTDAETVVVRSGAQDPKVRRIRRDPSVLVAACDFLGKPLGPPMRGTARILQRHEEATAERALAAALGWPRRLYNRTRAPLLPMTYIEIASQD